VKHPVRIGVFVATLAAAAAAACPEEPLGTPEGPAATSVAEPLAVHMAAFRWHDRARNRTLPATLYCPEGDDTGPPGGVSQPRPPRRGVPAPPARRDHALLGRLPQGGPRGPRGDRPRRPGGGGWPDRPGRAEDSRTAGPTNRQSGRPPCQHPTPGSIHRLRPRDAFSRRRSPRIGKRSPSCVSAERRARRGRSVPASSTSGRLCCRLAHTSNAKTATVMRTAKTRRGQITQRPHKTPASASAASAFVRVDRKARGVGCESGAEFSSVTAECLATRTFTSTLISLLPRPVNEKHGPGRITKAVYPG